MDLGKRQVEGKHEKQRHSLNQTSSQSIGKTIPLMKHNFGAGSSPSKVSLEKRENRR